MTFDAQPDDCTELSALPLTRGRIKERVSVFHHRTAKAVAIAPNIIPHWPKSV
jgi:hypothetical protein